MEFEVDIQNDLDLISFIYNYEVISIDGRVNEKKLIDYLNAREYYYSPSANQN